MDELGLTKQIMKNIDFNLYGQTQLLTNRINEILINIEQNLEYPRDAKSEEDLTRARAGYARKYVSALRDIFFWEFDLPLSVFNDFDLKIPIWKNPNRDSVDLAWILCHPEVYTKHRNEIIAYFVINVAYDLISKGFQLKPYRSKEYLDKYCSSCIIGKSNITFDEQ